MPITITSLQNGRIKELQKLAKHSERISRRVTLVEGTRECTHALASGIIPLESYVCPPLLDEAGRRLYQELTKLDAKRQSLLYEITPEVFAKIAYRQESGGLLLVIPHLSYHLKDFEPDDPAFVVVVEGVEKPGNLGAILRTADAAGVQAVIVTDGVTDIHNPNVVRSSLGSLFTIPVMEASIDETIEWLRRHQIQIIAASPEATHLYTEVDYRSPTVIVMGNEALGLSDRWRDEADAHVKIPMLGAMDSLNLSTSTALMLYEVIRQRHAR